MPTYGVAVTIPAPFGDALRAARITSGDPMARAIPPHVTLLPPTEIPDSAMAEFTDHLSAVAARHTAFEIRLNGTGTFRPVSPVVFVQVSLGIAACEALESAVRAGPVSRALEFPYHPHVTVAHHLSDDRLDDVYEALAGFRAEFTVDAFELYEQGGDEVWRPQRCFRLAPEVP